MQNVSTYYQAEIDYRREQIARGFRPARPWRVARRTSSTQADAA